MDGIELLQGDALTVLRTLPDASVSCCVTSPPYWGLRAYKAGAEEIGSESTPDAYVAALVAVFREVRRVLRDDGTLWLNLGDAYAGSGKGGNPIDGKQATNKGSQSVGVLYPGTGETAREAAATNVSRRFTAECDWLKPKDLIGLPWMVAFALRADGWYLRSEITWCKTAPMPESVRDRPTSATEKVFLLSKQARYFYDGDAVRTALSSSAYNDTIDARKARQRDGLKGNPTIERNGIRKPDKQRGHSRRHDEFNDRWDNMSKPEQQAGGANMRNYWLLGPQPSPLPHFASFPEELASRCIRAGTPPDGTVLDPFAGTATTLKVARDLGRKAVGIELSAEYCELARKRLDYGVKGVLAIANGQGEML